MKVLVYSGSSRIGNYTQHVAHFVTNVLNQTDHIEAELIKPDEVGINFSNEGNEADYPELRQKVVEADGFIFVTPEYNHGYSATIKYMFDLNLSQYNHKPVGLVGVSSGPFGGTRAIEALVLAVRESGLVACSIDLNFSNVQDEISDDGEVKNPQKWSRRAQKMIDEFSWLLTTLKEGRKQDQKE